MVTEVENIWEENRLAVMALLKQAHKGVKGSVKDQNGRPVSGAVIKVKQIIIHF